VTGRACRFNLEIAATDEMVGRGARTLARSRGPHSPGLEVAAGQGLTQDHVLGLPIRDIETASRASGGSALLTACSA